MSNENNPNTFFLFSLCCSVGFPSGSCVLVWTDTTALRFLWCLHATKAVDSHSHHSSNSKLQLVISAHMKSSLESVYVLICFKTRNINKKGKWGSVCRKLNPNKELRLLIGLLISCTLFDWFAINSRLWCIKDRGWRQPWSLWIPYTHIEVEGGKTSIHCCESGLVLMLILSASFVGAMRQSVWNNTFSEREVMDDLAS